MLRSASSSADARSPAIDAGEDVHAVIAGLRDALAMAQEQVRHGELALVQAHSELRLVSAALMTAQEMERKRIASELHDSIGQALNALSFGIGVAIDLSRDGDSSGATEMLGRLATQVKDTVEEVRHIAMALRPAILDDLGIVGTLSWFFREFRTIYPRVRLRTQVDIDEADVAVTLRTPIYRVVQEALNNIIKHAGANEVHVVLGRKPPRIVLEIKDNGRGFPVADDTLHAGCHGTGMGLTGMRDRVEFSGGEFKLSSAPGHGTVIRACWPLGTADVNCRDLGAPRDTGVSR